MKYTEEEISKAREWLVAKKIPERLVSVGMIDINEFENVNVKLALELLTKDFGIEIIMQASKIVNLTKVRNEVLSKLLEGNIRNDII